MYNIGSSLFSVLRCEVFLHAVSQLLQICFSRHDFRLGALQQCILAPACLSLSIDGVLHLGGSLLAVMDDGVCILDVCFLLLQLQDSRCSLEVGVSQLLPELEH